MADDYDEEVLTSKRVRLSSEGQKELGDEITKIQCLSEGFLQTKQESSEKEHGFDEETFERTVNSSEQYGDHSDSEVLEKLGSDDFPACFSVEDVLDDEEQRHFQPIAGPMGWIKRQMDLGIGPRNILTYMAPHAQVPPDVEDSTLWKIVIDILTEPTPRQKLGNVNTIDDVVELLKRSRNIIVLTGAGVSVSCGIPDFRSRDGVYAKLSIEYPDLPDPQAMFDISYFYNNPRPFFKFAKEIYPGQFKPSLSHRFIKQLESNHQLLRNYSQNIDTLEQGAGITRIIQCHGSFSTASCTNCAYRVTSDVIREDIFNQVIPLCPKCPQEKEIFAVMKPDIVFFGESLPADFYESLESDSQKADLLIVVGSSLKVRPVALIPSHIPPEVPQILINREPLRHMTFDVELLGDCDVILAYLCERLGNPWTNILQDFEIPPMESRLLSRIPTPPPEYLHNTGSSEVSAVTDNLDCHENENLVKNSKNLELSSSINTTSLPENKDKESECNSDSNVPHPNCGFILNELNNASDCGEGSGKTEDFPSSNYHDNGNEPPRFIFMPPSRFLFYGAEIMESPLPSPDTRLMASLHDGSSDCSFEDDQQNCTSSSSTEGSHCDVAGEGTYSDKTKGSGGAGVAFITGGLSMYTCESEESSVMSFSDIATGDMRDFVAVDTSSGGECGTHLTFQKHLGESGENMDNKVAIFRAVGELTTKLPPGIPDTKTLSGALSVSSEAEKSYTDDKMPCDESGARKEASHLLNCKRFVSSTSKGDTVQEETNSGEGMRSSGDSCSTTVREIALTPQNVDEKDTCAKETESVPVNINLHLNSRVSSAATSSNSNPDELVAALENTQSENGKKCDTITNCL